MKRSLRGGLTIALTLSVMYTCTLFAADRQLQLPKHLQQGQLVIGHAPAGAIIQFAGRRLRMSADGSFVFGLDRDAPAHVPLHVRYRDGKASALSLAVEKREYPIERVEGLPQKTVLTDPATT